MKLEVPTLEDGEFGMLRRMQAVRTWAHSIFNRKQLWCGRTSQTDRWFALINIADNVFTPQVQEEIIRRVDNMVNAAARHRGLPKGHYDDRMALAMQWNKFPNLKDHAVGPLAVFFSQADPIRETGRYRLIRSSRLLLVVQRYHGPARQHVGAAHCFAQ